MLLFAALVAGSFSFGKHIAHQVDPTALTAVRFVLAAAVLAPIVAMGGHFKATYFRAPWRFFVLGGLFVFYFVMMFEALKLTSAVSAAAVFTAMPFITAMLDRAVFGRQSPMLIWGALAIGACGALWVVFQGSWAALLNLNAGRGELLFLLGTISHAAYAVFLSRLWRGEPIQATSFGVTVAGAVILVVISWHSIAQTHWAALPPVFWATLAYLAIMATVATFMLITYAALRLPSAKVTAYTFLTPFWVICLESGLGNGLPGVFVLLGGIPIALALVLLFLEKT